MNRSVSTRKRDARPVDVVVFQTWVERVAEEAKAGRIDPETIHALARVGFAGIRLCERPKDAGARIALHKALPKLQDEYGAGNRSLSLPEHLKVMGNLVVHDVRLQVACRKLMSALMVIKTRFPDAYAKVGMEFEAETRRTQEARQRAKESSPTPVARRHDPPTGPVVGQLGYTRPRSSGHRAEPQPHTFGLLGS